MYRDMKIGLALGLLLIGTVAAFFFRNDPAPEEQAPKLKNAQAVTEQLTDKEGPKPYFDESPFENVERKQVQDVVELDGMEFKTENSSYPFKESPASREHNPFQETAQNQFNTQKSNDDWTTNQPRTPSPISQHKPVANENQAWNTVQSQPGKTGSKKQQSHLIHKVKRGDNLSSLAVYYLGSESRFLEIYQLNRDVLKSPNALLVGMKLRIPPKHASSPNFLEQSRTRNISSQRSRQPATQPQQSTTPGFSPANRSPFSPGSQRQRNRTLSQKAPPGRNSGQYSYANTRQKRYTIQRGDNLEKIALKIYGDRRAVHRLVEANRNVISNPNSIRPGIVLVLPNQ